MIDSHGIRLSDDQVRQLNKIGMDWDPLKTTLFSCDVVAGKSANDDIEFMQSEFDVAGISLIKDIELKFHVFDPETYDSLFDSEVISITTSVDLSFEQPYDNSGFLALDQNNMKVVIKKLNCEDSFWGAVVYVYIENNSETDAAIIQVRDVSVNGFMMEPMFSCEVLAGKKAYSSITFLEDDLIQDDITSIDNMELSFHIFNP